MISCSACEKPILDRFLLNVLDRAWHSACVRCADCDGVLTDKCYTREGRVYCRVDFFRRFGTKCSGCCLGISPCDLVRRARDKVFHLKCFTCVICRKQLSTGEQLYILGDNTFICKDDYFKQLDAGDPGFLPSDEEEEDVLDGKYLPETSISLPSTSPGLKSADLSNSPPSFDSLSNDDSAGEFPSLDKDTKEGIKDMSAGVEDVLSGGAAIDGKDCDDGPGNGKRRGPRTTIKAKQLEVLKSAFAATPKPTRHIREQLAKETGLNMRVIQVWFQNRRSKERRMKQLSSLNARRNFFRQVGGPRRMRPLQGGMCELEDAPGFPYFPEGMAHGGNDFGFANQTCYDFYLGQGPPPETPFGAPPGVPALSMEQNLPPSGPYTNFNNLSLVNESPYISQKAAINTRLSPDLMFPPSQNNPGGETFQREGW